MKAIQVKWEIPCDVFEELKSIKKVEEDIVRYESYFDYNDQRLLNASHYLRIVEKGVNACYIELITVFRLYQKKRFFTDRVRFEFPIRYENFRGILSRISGSSNKTLKDKELDSELVKEFLKNEGIYPQIDICQERFVWNEGTARITLCRIKNLGYYIEIISTNDRAKKIFESIVSKEVGSRLIDFGYVDIYMNENPTKFYSTVTKQRMFADNSQWNILDTELDLYNHADSAKEVWINIHFPSYDLYVAHYLDNLLKAIDNIERLNFVYWDNLIYPEITDDCLTDRNIVSLKCKLDKEIPMRYSIHRFSDVKKTLEKDIGGAIEKIRYYIDSDILKKIIEISKPSLNIQVVNNMIEDFVLCCFFHRMSGRKVDVYYTGTRFKPMESLFRKYLYEYKGMHFPEIEYVSFPPCFDDLAKLIKGDASDLEVRRTISAFLHHHPDKEKNIFNFFRVNNRNDLEQIILQKLEDGKC